MAQRILRELQEHGEVQRAWLGVTIRDVDQTMADVYGLERPQGVLVNNVNDDTPAAEAGVEPEDIILAVDGEPVNSVSELRNKISLTPVGNEVELRILRDGRETTKRVTLGELPNQDTVARRDSVEETDGIPGVTVAELNDRVRARFEIPDAIDGVVVTDVDQGSAAQREGLARGDIIMELNRERLDSVRDYRDALRRDEDKPFFLRIYRPQQEARLYLAIPR
jgi:S1-C subfamily serine protease